MNVRAVVVAGVRRCVGVHPLTPLAGVPLLVRSIRTVLAAGVVERVSVLLDPGADPLPFEAACAGLAVDVHAGALRHALSRVRPHARQRADATDGDDLVTVGSGDVVLVHDAMRALTPSALITTVVDAVRAGHLVAVPVLPLADTVKQVDSSDTVRGTPDRGGLLVVQTPQAFRGDVLVGALGTGGDPFDMAVELAADGVAVHTVPGAPQAFAVRTPWGLEQAELLAGMITA